MRTHGIFKSLINGQEHAKRHTSKSSQKIKRQVEEMRLIKGNLKLISLTLQKIKFLALNIK